MRLAKYWKTSSYTNKGMLIGAAISLLLVLILIISSESNIKVLDRLGIYYIYVTILGALVFCPKTSNAVTRQFCRPSCYKYIILPCLILCIGVFIGALVGLLIDTRKGIKKKETYSNVLPIKKLVIYSIATLGFYNLYWYYKNWQLLKKAGDDIRPVWRTFGLLVPIVSYWFIYDQIKRILRIAQEKRYKSKADAVRLIAIIFVIKSLDRIAYKVSDSFPIAGDILGMISLILMVVPLASVQIAFNYYWEKTQKLPINSKFSIKDYFIVVAGLLILALTFIS
ncbi:hypothetical protein JW930_01885 [Candidatus Woesearchaeota archaeon]|nr:hypothetical protein [Candidatus Woesearchaeota archaeon]